MAFTEVYVDPSIAADSGTGAPGDPYGDLEYAVEQVTFDTTNGTRFNIKAGTAEVLAANLHTATQDTGPSIAYVTGVAAPLVFQGYTTTAGDGGRGAITSASATAIWSSTSMNYINFIDIDFVQTGAAESLSLNDSCVIMRCKWSSATAQTTFPLTLDGYCLVDSCYFVAEVSDSVMKIDGPATLVQNCFVENTSSSGSAVGIELGAMALRNIVVMANGSAITVVSRGMALSNSIYGPSVSAYPAINISGYCTHVENNVIEGYNGGTGTGVGGSGVANYYHLAIRGNAVYLADTPYIANLSTKAMDTQDNETLSASPFTAVTTDDFSPVDTGNIKEGSIPGSIAGDAGAP